MCVIIFADSRVLDRLMRRGKDRHFSLPSAARRGLRRRRLIHGPSRRREAPPTGGRPDLRSDTAAGTRGIRRTSSVVCPDSGSLAGQVTCSPLFEPSRPWSRFGLYCARRKRRAAIRAPIARDDNQLTAVLVDMIMTDYCRWLGRTGQAHRPDLLEQYQRSRRR